MPPPMMTARARVRTAQRYGRRRRESVELGGGRADIASRVPPPSTPLRHSSARGCSAKRGGRLPEPVATPPRPGDDSQDVRNAWPTMTEMDASARKRRGRRWLMLITVVVIGGSALLGRALRTTEDVHRGSVSYFAPEQDAASDPEVVKSRAEGTRAVAWAGWGFDSGHRRHNPQAQQRPPFTQIWAAGLDSLVEFPPVVDDRGVFIETFKGSIVSL